MEAIHAHRIHEHKQRQRSAWVQRAEFGAGMHYASQNVKLAAAALGLLFGIVCILSVLILSTEHQRRVTPNSTFIQPQVNGISTAR